MVQDAYKSHNDKLATLKEILNEIERRPTVIADKDFPIELTQLQGDIDDLYDKVKTATGEESIIHQVQDIRNREKKIGRTLETVKESIDGIQAKTDEAVRIGNNTDLVLETVSV